MKNHLHVFFVSFFLIISSNYSFSFPTKKISKNDPTHYEYQHSFSEYTKEEKREIFNDLFEQEFSNSRKSAGILTASLFAVLSLPFAAIGLLYLGIFLPPMITDRLFIDKIKKLIRYLDLSESDEDYKDKLISMIYNGKQDELLNSKDINSVIASLKKYFFELGFIESANCKKIDINKKICKIKVKTGINCRDSFHEMIKKALNNAHHDTRIRIPTGTNLNLKMKMKTTSRGLGGSR